MKRDQEEELKRLEEALLAEMPWEEKCQEEDPLDWVEELYEENPISCDIYNTDDTDVDFEEYSQQVHAGRQRNFLPVLLFLISLGALAGAVVLFLRYMGVIP